MTWHQFISYLKCYMNTLFTEHFIVFDSFAFHSISFRLCHCTFETRKIWRTMTISHSNFSVLKMLNKSKIEQMLFSLSLFFIWLYFHSKSNAYFFCFFFFRRVYRFGFCVDDRMRASATFDLYEMHNIK